MISRSLKAIAKELNIPIIALSQLNRSVESRGGNKRPQLSDLRESGAIEQDADLVAFIHRPEYYGLMTDEDGTPTQGMAEIIVAKHRNGAVDTIKLRFRKEQAKFMDYDDISGDGFSMDSSMNSEFGSAIDGGNARRRSNERFRRVWRIRRAVGIGAEPSSAVSARRRTMRIRRSKREKDLIFE